MHTGFWTCCVSAREEAILAPWSRKRKQIVPKGGCFGTSGIQARLYTKESPKVERTSWRPGKEGGGDSCTPSSDSCLLMSCAEQRDSSGWRAGSVCKCPPCKHRDLHGYLSCNLQYPCKSGVWPCVSITSELGMVWSRDRRSYKVNWLAT